MPKDNNALERDNIKCPRCKRGNLTVVSKENKLLRCDTCAAVMDLPALTKEMIANTATGMLPKLVTIIIVAMVITLPLFMLTYWKEGTLKVMHPLSDLQLAGLGLAILGAAYVICLCFAIYKREIRVVIWSTGISAQKNPFSFWFWVLLQLGVALSVLAGGIMLAMHRDSVWYKG